MAFSLLTITMILLSQFDVYYWNVALYALICMHATELFSFSIELLGFARKTTRFLKFNFLLTILACVCSIIVQAYFGASFQQDIEQRFLIKQ